MQTQFIFNDTDGVVDCKLISREGTQLSRCVVTVDEDVLRIRKWETVEAYRHSGYGKEVMCRTLKYILNIMPLPGTIEYTWNGVNSYVYDWMTRNFDAICNCPIAVQKKCPDDDWDSHIYTLNRDKFIDYMGLL